MKNTFNAAILDKIKKPLELVENIILPKLKKDQVLIKMKYTAICGSQIFEIDGKRGVDRFLPHMLGHEGTGVVIKVGNINSKFKKHDKVFLSWIKKNRKKNNTIEYINPINGNEINAGPITTFSSYTIVSENRVYKLPKKVDLKKGVLLGCALPTGAGMVFNQSRNLRSKSVLVIGSGGVGLSVILALKLKNTKKIFVYDINRKKINFLNKFIKNIYFSDKISELNQKNLSYDYVFECSGKTQNIELGFKLLKDNGKCIFASHPEFKKKISFDPHEFIKGKKIEGSWGGQVNFKKDLKKLTDLMIKFNFINKIYFKKEYSLFNINKAIHDFKNGKNIRTLIKLS